MVRKYFSVSKNVHKALEVYAEKTESTIKTSVERLIDLGLRYEKEAHRRPENEKIFDQRLSEFKYSVGRSVRTYLAVSPKTFDKVKEYSYKKELKMVEGTWRLLSIGMQYSLGDNPRNDPRFKIELEIVKSIEDHLEKKYGLPVEKYLNIKDSSLEDRVIQLLYQARMKSEGAYKRRRTSASTINVLSIMEAEYAAMLLGAQTMIEKLEKQNEILERKIAGMEKLLR